MLTHFLLQCVECMLLSLCPFECFSFLCQLREWSGDLTEHPNELAIVANEANEGLNLRHGLERRPLEDRLHFFLHHVQTAVIDYMAEKLDARLEQLTLAGFGVQLTLAQEFQYFSYVSAMVRDVVAVHPDVINEHQHASV